MVNPIRDIVQVAKTVKKGAEATASAVKTAGKSAGKVAKKAVKNPVTRKVLTGKPSNADLEILGGALSKLSNAQVRKVFSFFK
jgi:hypothetical protein